MVAGKEGTGIEPGLGAKRHLGEPAQALPSTLQFLCPCQVQRGGENMLETGPPTHIGEPPCSNPAGDKGIIVRPTDTLLSN